MARLRTISIIMALAVSLSACAQLGIDMNPPAPPPAAAPQAQAPQNTATPSGPNFVLQATWTPSGEKALNQDDDQASSTPSPKRGMVWAVNDEDRTVIMVDPNTNTIVAHTQIDGKPLALAEGEGAVWVIEDIDQTHSNILRVDKTSKLIASRIPIAYGAAKSITTGGGSVWVGIAEPVQITAMPKSIDYNQPGGVVRIDPNLNQVTDYIKTKAVSAGLVYADDLLYVLEWLYMLTRIDKINPASKEITSLPANLESSDYIQQFAAITKNASGIWAIPIDQESTFIFRVDPADGKVTSQVEVGQKDVEIDRPVAITSDADSIWVAMKGGNVVRVNPADGSITAKIYTSSVLSGIFSAQGSIWAVSRQDANIFQIDPAVNLVSGNLRSGSKPRPTPTASQTPMPTPISETWNPCDNSYVSHIRVGINAIVSTHPPLPNRVRSEARNNAKIIGYIKPGEKVEVQTGPTCANGWIWWFVRSNKTGLTGWTSEGDGKDYWINPSP